MTRVHEFLQTVFPLPESLQQLIQAEAFLIISPKPQLSKKSKSTFIRCIQYPTEKQARENQIKYTSLSNAFHLEIKNSKIKPIQNNLTWCLIIEMQSPKMSFKQKINMNKKASKSFTQTELIMIINCMNILLNKYFILLESKNITANQLIDNIFVTENQLIKLSVLSLVCPLKENALNKLSVKSVKNVLQKFSMLLFQTLTMQENNYFEKIDVLERSVDNLKFKTFCLKELKAYLLGKILPHFRKEIVNKSFEITNKQISNQVNQNEYFPKTKVSKKARTINKNKEKTSNQSEYQKTQDELSTFANHLSQNFATLNEMAHNKFAQSFQSDEYSYILQSQNSSPIRTSPCKGATNSQHQQSTCLKINKFSPLSFSPQISSQLQNSHQMQRLPVEGHNSIIFEVEQESNYELIETESMTSQLIELSLSRENENDQVKFGEVKVQEIVNEEQETKYYGEVRNGLKQGHGKLFYNDGGYYEGDWKSDNITGFGRLFYPSGKLAYAGYWHDGSFHGPGLVLNEQIDPIIDDKSRPFDYSDLSNLGRAWVSYRGNFNMDVRKGFGMVKLWNDDSISGVWEDNCLHGQGEYRRKDGSIVKGVWEMNKLVNVLCQKEKCLSK